MPRRFIYAVRCLHAAPSQPLMTPHPPPRRFINHSATARRRRPPPARVCLPPPRRVRPYAQTPPAGEDDEAEACREQMGNCQAAEAATVVVQHPGGRVERLYWATSAAEVMRANPGHYVALVTHRAAAAEEEEKRPRPKAARQEGEKPPARVTRVKLLKPRDMLLLGQAYRLITVDDVSRALQAKKEEKTRRAAAAVQQSKHAGGATAGSGEEDSPRAQQLDDSLDQDRDGHRSNPSSAAHSGARHRHWRPSLHSIAEVSS
ncbi:hypothetical protein ACP4OV_017015 [Aristida adscensionis]